MSSKEKIWHYVLFSVDIWCDECLFHGVCRGRSDPICRALTWHTPRHPIHGPLRFCSVLNVFVTPASPNKSKESFFFFYLRLDWPPWEKLDKLHTSELLPWNIFRTVVFLMFPKHNSFTTVQTFSWQLIPRQGKGVVICVPQHVSVNGLNSFTVTLTRCSPHPAM